MAGFGDFDTPMKQSGLLLLISVIVSVIYTLLDSDVGFRVDVMILTFLILGLILIYIEIKL